MGPAGYLMFAAFLAILGIAFLKVSPYRPDLGGDRNGSEMVDRSNMGWWTGNRTGDCASARRHAAKACKQANP
jgi:hypothetical protein